MDSQPLSTLRHLVERPTVWLLLAIHVVFWTCLAWLTQPNLPLDSAEILYWGREWQWGYYKHPPLPAWIAELAFQAGGGTTWLIYIVPPIAMAVCLGSVWRVARGYVSPVLALTCMVILEASYYFHHEACDINNNIIGRPFWALTVLGAYLAIFEEKKLGWVLAGMALGLAMLAKYDAAVLALVLLAYSVADRRGRAAWRTSGPYLMLALALAIFAPHAKWLIENDFPTIRYFMQRSGAPGHWTAHFAAPAEFLLSQLAAVIPLVGLAWLLIDPKSPAQSADENHAAKYRFILAVGLGPLVLVLLISAVLGIGLRAMWGGPLWTWAPLLVLATYRPNHQPERIRLAWRLSLGIACLFAVSSATRDVVLPYLRHRAPRVAFNGKALAAQVAERWRQHTDQELTIVAGDSWPAGNVAAYLPERPSVFCSLESHFSPWLSREKLLEKGGVIIVSGEKGAEEPRLAAWLADYPGAKLEEPIIVPWHTKAAIKPAIVQIAIVPPAKECAAQLAERGNRKSGANR